jgi:hypothetical protein
MEGNAPNAEQLSDDDVRVLKYIDYCERQGQGAPVLGIAMSLMAHHGLNAGEAPDAHAVIHRLQLRGFVHDVQDGRQRLWRLTEAGLRHAVSLRE